MKRTMELEMRRRLLVLRSERLRGELVEEGYRVQHALGSIDRAVALVRRVATQPTLLAAAAAGLFLFRRPLRTAVWGTKVAAYVSLARRILGLLQAVGVRPRIAPR